MKVAGILPERRRAHRTKVELRVFFPWSERFIEGRTIDISESGVRIQADADLKVGTRFVLHFGPAEQRATDRLAVEPVAAEEPALRDAVCACMHDLLPSMKPEYAQVVRAVDLEDRSLAEVAAGGGITVNNATVRLHRARQALKKELLRACGACAAHGCLECGCRTGARPGGRSAG